MRSGFFTTLVSLTPLIAAGVALISHPRRAEADPQAGLTQERAQRCANRLSIAMVGETASDTLANSPDPQSGFDTLVTDPRFVERFSRFINSQFNRNQGNTAIEDASYYMTQYVIQNGKPWTEMFVGKYDITGTNGDNTKPQVVDNPDGLGYFRSRAWTVRYEGNEPAGIRIVTGYRMMQNTLGLKLVATSNGPGADISANGRKSDGCKSCHYENWYALDEVASVLGTRQGTADKTTFIPPDGTPKAILGGVMIKDDAELVQALVSNEAFDVNAARLSFKYLYGRAEYSCEGPLFDKAAAAFKADKMIQSALRTIVKDSTFCE